MQLMRKIKRSGSVGWLGFSRIIVVSHRLPVKLASSSTKNNISFEETVRLKGVVAGVSAMKRESREVLWVGCVPSLCQLDAESRAKAVKILNEQNYFPVPLDSEDIKGHFTNFCKGVLWPMFHYYGEADVLLFPESDWNTYYRVNFLYTEVIQSIYQPGDIILVHDYQLMLVPGLLREKIPTVRVGFFLQVPWPSCEIYRRLTVRKEILLGMLGADLIAFQAFPYARHFFSACIQILGLAIPSDMSGVEISGQFVKVEVIPTGIESRTYLEIIHSPEFAERKKKIKDGFKGKYLLVSSDRIEPKSGIILKLNAFKAFLDAYPKYRENVVLFQECTSNEDVVGSKLYKRLLEDIEKLIGSINGLYSTINHTPIIYARHTHAIEDLLAIFSSASAAIITPKRDGMNLISHEFVISQNGSEEPAPIILSEFTGAAQCLGSAILVNPWDIQEVVSAIHEALTMTREEKVLRHASNLEYVKSNTARQWIIALLRELTMANRNEALNAVHHLQIESVISSYWKSNQKLFLLDCATLFPKTQASHLLPAPHTEVLTIASLLCEEPTNDVYLLSCETPTKMMNWFGSLNVGLIAECGAFFRPIPGSSEGSPEWQNRSEHGSDLSWRETVLGWLHAIKERAPEAIIEQKEVILAMHFPKNSEEYDEKPKNQLLMYLHGNPKLPVVPVTQTSRVLDSVFIVPRGLSNCSIVKELMCENDYDFVVCVGNEQMDGGMFTELSKHQVPHLFTVTLQEKPTSAKYYMSDYLTVLKLLSSFTNKPA